MGGTAGVLLTLWLSIGSMTIHHKHPSLPSLSVEHCSHGNSNSTFLTSTLNDYNFSLSEISDGLWTKNWNQTTEAVPDSKSHVVSVVYENGMRCMTWCHSISNCLSSTTLHVHHILSHKLHDNSFIHSIYVAPLQVHYY